MFSYRSLVVLLCASAAVAAPAISKRDGSTAFLVGQNYADEWAAFQSGTRKTPAGISLYGDIWSGALNSDSTTFLPSYASQHSGYVEVGFSWKDAMDLNGYTQYTGGLMCRDIAAGKYDANVNKFADQLAQYSNVKYLVRLDYEVSTNVHANTNPAGNDPSTWDLHAYPNAFAHVRQLIAAKVPNAEFVYHAVRGEGPTLYPGDNVVDWNGISIFNNDLCLLDGPVPNNNCGSGTVDLNVQKDLDWMPKRKMISESAVQPPSSSDPNGFINYLNLVNKLVEANNVEAWVYINSNWPTHAWSAEYWGDSRIEANPPVLDWFNANIASNNQYTWG